MASCCLLLSTIHRPRIFNSRGQVTTFENCPRLGDGTLSLFGAVGWCRNEVMGGDSVAFFSVAIVDGNTIDV